MKKLILFFLLALSISFNAFALTTTTTGAGAWNTAGNWDNGVPTVDDDPVISHAMSVGATGATFSTLDNNSTITLTANQTWTIKDAGSIDNAGGTIDCDTNDIDWSLTASTGTTRYTWLMDSGTWDVGSGETHFADITITFGASYTDTETQGHVFFGENCWVSMVAGESGYWNIYDLTIDEGVTLRLGLTDTFRLQNVHNLTAVGTSGNHIDIDCEGAEGWLQAMGNDSSTINIQYVDSNDGGFGFYFSSIDTVEGDSFTCNNLTATNQSAAGYYFNNCKGTLTFSDCSSSLNTTYGIYILGSATGAKFIFNDFETFSNSSGGAYLYGNYSILEMNRSKSYSNTLYGCNEKASLTSSYFTLNNCLIRENTWAQVAGTNNDDCSMMNCTIADATNSHPNISVDLDTGGFSFDITNCIISNGKYSINSTGTSEDPTVTYTDAYGADTSNYNGMTDPTGSNGNISEDPLFTDAGGDDYSITTSSPCIGIGTATGAPADDIDGNTRPMPTGTKPDMGAYEEQTITLAKSYIIFVN